MLLYWQHGPPIWRNIFNVAVHFPRTVSVRAVLIGQRLNYWMFMFMYSRETRTRVNAQQLTERDLLQFRGHTWNGRRVMNLDFSQSL